jgi:3-methylcrotonyl-CoA carboxylase alpha subunit
MFGRILIANRGEIACRIARTARRLDIATVAIYSDADAHALHVTLCDEAYRVGAPPPRESYLNGDAIIAIAKRAGAQAIHPGYGVLSENAAFAQACEAAGLVFIGPPAAAIAAMGSKSAAKAIMSDAGVPVVPGYHGDDQDEALLAREAARIGFPVLIKATAGGGGKGMKAASTRGEFGAALASAKREARASFGDDRVLLERYLASPRHIEMQVFADRQGHAVHLFERDCSVQRRHQKVLEEAPAPGMDDARRRAMGEAAVAAAKAIGYVGAGTVEFIAEQDGTFYFMEMNTRLQVEHPVTEMITGLDLVEWQLRVAAGEPLPKTQSEVAIHGHAIEARVYAEDPERDFLPSIGRIVHWRMPEEMRDVRVDTGYRAGDDVTPFYDPMLAKVIAWGENREAARRRLVAALGQCEVTGVTTNVAFLERVVMHDAFASGRVDTGLIATHRDELREHSDDVPRHALIAAALAEYTVLADAKAAVASQDPWSPWRLDDAWWNGTSTHHATFAFAEGGREHRVTLVPRGDDTFDIGGETFSDTVRAKRRGARWSIERAGDASPIASDTAVVAHGDGCHVFAPGVRTRLSRVDPFAEAEDAGALQGRLTAPMSGTIVAVMVQPGDIVDKGAALVVLEAMKMEHTIVAPAAGRVGAVHFAAGDRVSEGVDLVDVDTSQAGVAA